MDLTLAVGGIGLIGALVAWGQLWKSIGIESKWIPFINIITSLCIVLPIQYSRGPTTIEQWITTIVVGITIALASSGFYSEQKNLRQ